MTSQIGMMNKDSVALASDSAVTWGARGLGPSFNTSEKIFQLAGRQTVGFMTAGRAAYMGLSWDRILGMYRERIGTKEKDGNVAIIGSVNELNHISSDDPDNPGYVEDFINFLNTNPNLQSDADQEQAMFWEIQDFIQDSLEPHYLALKNQVDNQNQHQNALRRSESNIADSIVQRQYKLHKQFSELFEVSVRDFSEWLRDDIDSNVNQLMEVVSEEQQLIDNLCEVYSNVMYEGKVSSSMKESLSIITGCYIAGKLWLKAYSGGSNLVIAGFGKLEELPTMVEVRFWSKWKDKMRYVKLNSYHEECVVPFAQSDQMITIIRGYSTDVSYGIEKGLAEELPEVFSAVAQETAGVGKATMEKLLLTLEGMEFIPGRMRDNILRKLRSGNFTPFDIMRLSPDDLAKIAGKLVDLESSIQYVNHGLGASVGGEIDVVSITKEDGFVWVRRKNKLDQELNPRIFKQPRDRARHI